MQGGHLVLTCGDLQICSLQYTKYFRIASFNKISELLSMNNRLFSIAFQTSTRNISFVLFTFYRKVCDQLSLPKMAIGKK